MPLLPLALLLLLFSSSVFAQPYSVTGSITAAGEAVGLKGRVVAFDAGRNLVAEVETVSGGDWTLSLNAGDYWIYAETGHPYQYFVAEMHDGTQCPAAQCGDWSNIASPDYITPVTVAGAETVPDFDLAQGVTISGDVIDDNKGLCLNNITIDFYDAGENFVFQVTGNTCPFLTPALPLQSYLMVTTETTGTWASEVYDDVSCPLEDCLSVLGSGTRISPAAGTDFNALVSMGLLSDVPLIFRDGFEGE